MNSFGQNVVYYCRAAGQLAHKMYFILSTEDFWAAPCMYSRYVSIWDSKFNCRITFLKELCIIFFYSLTWLCEQKPYNELLVLVIYETLAVKILVFKIVLEGVVGILSHAAVCFLLPYVHDIKKKLTFKICYHFKSGVDGEEGFGCIQYITKMQFLMCFTRIICNTHIPSVGKNVQV